jgi:hypothetical protein
MGELIALLMQISKIPGEHLGYWQSQEQSYTFWKADDDHLVVALNPGDVYLLEAATKNDQGGILTTVLVEVLEVPPDAVIGGECSLDGQEQTPGVVAQFDASQKGFVLTNPIRAWQATATGFTFIPVDGISCINNFADLNHDPYHDSDQYHDSHHEESPS